MYTMHIGENDQHWLTHVGLVDAYDCGRGFATKYANFFFFAL